MQLPKRKSQQRRPEDEELVVHLTQEGVDRLHRELERLDREKPKAIEDLSVALAKGDLSENAEYTDARAKLSRIEGRIFSIKDRLKRIAIIEKPDPSHGVRIGSTVHLRKLDGAMRTYEIVGPRETDPTRGRISYQSPLGVALLGKNIGDHVTYETSGSTIEVDIENIL